MSAGQEPAEMPEPVSRLLLVEDDPIGAEWLLHTLRGWGLSVEHAQDCAHALAREDLPSFHGLLLDQRLPDGEGRALLGALRRRGAQGQALALSADLDADQQAALDHAGYVRCLRKPVEPATLLEALRAAGLSPPQWDDARALACANGRISIAQSLRSLMLSELPAQREALRAASAPVLADPQQLDALLHRMLGSARLTGAAALVAHIESVRAHLQPDLDAARAQLVLARIVEEIDLLLTTAVRA